MRLIIPILMLLLLLPAYADIYKWVDERGDVHYSDQPHPDAEKISLPEPTSYSPDRRNEPSGSNMAGPADAAEQSMVPGAMTYKGLRITKPLNDATLRSNSGRVEVSLEVLPILVPGHRIRLFLDGREVMAGLRTTQVALNNMSRGTHSLHASIYDSANQLRITSDKVRFHLHRKSDDVQDHIKPPEDNQQAYGPDFEGPEPDSTEYEGTFEDSDAYPETPQGEGLYPDQSSGAGQYPEIQPNPGTFTAPQQTYTPNYGQQ